MLGSIFSVDAPLIPTLRQQHAPRALPPPAPCMEIQEYVAPRRRRPPVGLLLYKCCGRVGHEAAIRDLLEQGRARLVATTLGADGCIIVTR